VLDDDLDVWFYVGERRTKRGAMKLAKREAATAAEVYASLHFG
jgi:hypothetical protein